MDKLVINNLTKVYNGSVILDNISFSVKKGEFLSILGSSGCGKTTLLRILIGIEPVTSGKILLEGNDITNEDPSKRKMGMVFQNYALFPNMTVLENVSYPLKLKYKDKKKAKEEALSFLKMVNMENFKDKYPSSLSGGQKQRVAIARTLSINPEIILFDEALSALDASNKYILRKEIKNLQEKMGITIIYITHDQEEAFSMSSRVMVMKDGKIEQLDTPNKIFNNPKTEFVKTFCRDHLINKVKSIESCTKIDL